MKLNSTLNHRIIISEFFSEAIPIYALIPLMFASYGSMNALQVGTLLALWQILITVFEVPTGVIADIFGRRTSLSVGKLLRILCYPIWLLVPNFTGFALGILFLALGDALISGSLEAYSYDELKNKKSYNSLRQRTVAIHLLAFTVAGAISYLLDAQYRQILIASMIMSFIGYLLSFILPKDQPSHGLSSRSLLKKAIVETVTQKQIAISFVIATLSLAVMVIFIEQLNLFYSDAGISDRNVALLITIGNLVTFVLFWFTTSIEKAVRKTVVLLIGIALLALCLSVTIGNIPALQIAIIFIFVRLLRLANIHLSNDLQHLLPTSTRATVGSISSFVAKLLTACSLVYIGYASNETSDIRIPLVQIGIVFVSLMSGFYIYKSKMLNRHIS